MFSGYDLAQDPTLTPLRTMLYRDNFDSTVRKISIPGSHPPE